MSKRTLACPLLAFLLSFSLVQHASVVTARSFDWSALPSAENISSVSETEQETSDAPQKKQGNGFVRALGAPFRAIGRL